MKVKMLSRNPDDYVRETTKDIQRVPRNLEPLSHPFEVSREYTRALNAAKTERLLAKPYVGQLAGHGDTISCMATHPQRLATLLSGAADGEVRVWDMTRRVSVGRVRTHDGAVRGLSVHADGHSFLTVGDDKTIKQWSVDSVSAGESVEPLHTIVVPSPLCGVDCHVSEDAFVTSGGSGGGSGGSGSGACVSLWRGSRSTPVLSLPCGDSATCVRFNPVQSDLVGSCGSDRSIVLFDIRSKTPIKKVIMEMRSNSLAWNPMVPSSFTVANEDYNLYTWDMRSLDCVSSCHRGHVSAVLDVWFSPTGSEFVSGSFDRTIRVFGATQGHSREVYHTKRMQHVFAVRWSLDNKFLLSASDEMNIRVWKANAADKLGVVLPRERASMEYSRSLREKFASFPSVRRVARHRHVPGAVHTAWRELTAMREARRKRERNQRAHSKPGSVPVVPERRKHIVATLE